MKKPSASKKPASLKIAFVYDDSLDGNEGVAQYVKTLGTWLSDHGHQVAYFVGQTKIKNWHGGPVYSLSRNISVTFNGNKLSMPLISSKAKIKQALSEFQPDVISLQMPHSPLMGQRVVRQTSAAIVGTFHIFPASRLVAIAGRLLKLLYLGGLRKIDDVVSVSSAASIFARQSLNLSGEVVPNMIDAAALKSDQVNRPMTIVYLGRLVERKGCQQLIEAFYLVHQQLPQAKLIIGGRGQLLAELEKLCFRLGLTAAVEFKGFIAEEDKGKFLAQASVACFPSLYGESFGIVLIEAMAAGAGVVLGGDNPGYRSVLADMPEALFDPTDKQALAAKLVDYLSDDSLRDDLHRRQAKHVKQFDVNVVGRQMLAHYTSAIAKKQNGRHN